MSLTCLREASEVDDLLQERDDLVVEAAVMRGHVARLERLVEYAARNAGRTASSRMARWAHVRDTFAVGSTTAKELCRTYRLDPDEVIGGSEDAGDEHG